MTSMDESAGIFARHLLAAVGEVMLYWGYLESAMLESLDEGAWTPAIVQRWSAAARPGDQTLDQIRGAAAIRNLLAHGLCAVDARPRHGGEAEVTCRNPDGELVRISLSALRETALQLDRLRLQLR